MGVTPEQYHEMLIRLEGNKAREGAPANAVEYEITGLHEPIIKWCRSFVPNVPYIHHRTDRKSGIAEGAPDFIIFFRGQVFLFECKAKTGKRTMEQLGWGLCAENQGFKVHVIYSMEEFHQIISSANSGAESSPTKQT